MTKDVPSIERFNGKSWRPGGYSAQSPPLVDLDLPETWPQEFRALVEDLGDSPQSLDEFLDQDLEQRASSLFEGHLLTAYHCTRLTRTELESVRNEGLIPLSASHTKVRLERAAESGDISGEQRDWLLREHLAHDPNRAGQVCLFTDKASLNVAREVGWLLRAWGGEGINMSVHTGSPEFQVFETIGIPTVVIAALDLSVHGGRFHPGLVLSALRTLKSDDGGTSVYSWTGVGPNNIIGLEHPNSKFWIEHVWTPAGGFR